MLKTYLVGGAVRDHFLGIKTKDLDFVIETTSYDDARIFIAEDLGCKIVQERPEYQVFRAVHPILGGVDFALPRGDFNQDGRHSETRAVGSIQEDLARRDFTMNAMAVRCYVVGGVIMPDYRKIIDPFGGGKDIENRILTFVGSAKARIEEDNLRVLRALRFALTKGMEFSAETQMAIIETVISDKVSAARIFEELNRMFAVSNTKTIDVLAQASQLYLLDRIVLKATT